MQFELLEKNWTDEAASIWGDMLELGRPATYAEAKADLDKNGFGGQFADYFDSGEYMGPCPMGISIKGWDDDGGEWGDAFRHHDSDRERFGADY